MKRLYTAALLALLTLICVPAYAQTPTGLQIGIIRGATISQPCLFVRSGTICDPFGTIDNNTGIFTPFSVNIQTYIHAGETTIDNALTRADAVLATTGGGILRFPAQASCYVLAARHIVTTGSITYQGDYGNSSCIQANFDDDAVMFGDGTANPEGVHVKGLMFKNTSGVTRTKGSFIRFRNTYNSSIEDNIFREGAYVNVDIDGGGNQWTTRVLRNFIFTGYDGIRIGNAGSRLAQETFLEQNSIANQTHCAVEALSAGGLYTHRNSAIANNMGFCAFPGTGTQVSGLIGTGDLWDTQSSYGVWLKSNGGIISQVNWDGVWAATCGQAVGSLTQDPTAACIRIEGAANQVFGIRMKGLQAYNAATNGILVAGGDDIHLEGRVTANSTVSHGANANVIVSPNVSNWSFRGRAGGVLSSGVVGSPLANFAPYGVQVLAGSSDYYTIDCNCSGNTLADVLDSASGAHRYINSLNGLSNIQTGVWTHTGAETFQQTIASTVATGTAPFTVASTSKVVNLYADRAALADTVTTNANLTGDVTSVGNATTYNNIVSGAKGGTGVANTSKTITIGANLTTTGAGAPTLAFPASPFTYTFQGSSDTMVGRATTDTLTNKTLTSPAITTPTGIVKGDVGLGNVDNTSDATKNAAVATLTNKTISGASNTLTAIGAGSLSLSQITAALGADVALNNTAAWFDGPSVAQGSTGTWFASGYVTLFDTGNNGNFLCRLTDGTNIIASAQSSGAAVGQVSVVALSGFRASPASNLRIACRDAAATTGVMKFNSTGDSRDSQITAFRVN